MAEFKRQKKKNHSRVSSAGAAGTLTTEPCLARRQPRPRCTGGELLCGAFDVGRIYPRCPGRNPSAFHVWLRGRQRARRDLIRKPCARGTGRKLLRSLGDAGRGAGTQRAHVLRRREGSRNGRCSILGSGERWPSPAPRLRKSLPEQPPAPGNQIPVARAGLGSPRLGAGVWSPRREPEERTREGKGQEGGAERRLSTGEEAREKYQGHDAGVGTGERFVRACGTGRLF